MPLSFIHLGTSKIELLDRKSFTKSAALVRNHAINKLKSPIQVISCLISLRATKRSNIIFFFLREAAVRLFSPLQELRPINEENNLKMKEPNEGALPSMCFKHGVLSADGVDKAARVLFPSIFCLFNVIYWIYYTQPVVYVDVE